MFVGLLDTLGIEQVPVLGFSAGSTSAALLALRHPDRVSGLILVCANAPHEKASSEVIGDGTLFLLSAEHRQGEIGFVFNPEHHGHGYATETAGLLLELAFVEFGLHRVIGRLEPRNAASARVLERVGMRREAHFRENEFVKGEWQSELVYAILGHEWRAGREFASADSPAR